ncbi:phosphopyruvate hydratase [Ulvibacterium marinum]|uniref:phosphopyruvate hydratase n=1 Tax=Ulvibacterium marinum TaxID=2419782 RepID=UPI0024940658|nr:phosphopyruvate hydratase [Ulvibacterium marinum]
MTINAVEAYAIFDSRGNPTVEVEVRLNNEIIGRGVAPSGASTGQFEAHELRDDDPLHFDGKSVNKAIGNVNGIIAPALIGKDPRYQKMIDELMITLDGTPNKTVLGANAILAVSTAVAAATANALGLPLFAYLGEAQGNLLPFPEIQIIGGGAHAQWRTDVQDFLLIANGASSYEETLEITSDVFRATGEILKEQNRYFGVADEGGYWPEFESHDQIFETFIQGIEKAGYKPGTDASIALDIAASDLYDEKSKTYRFRLENKVFSQDEFFDLLCSWLEKYPIVSLEDPFADTDLENWRRLMEDYGDTIQIIGDDLFTTHPDRIKQGIQHKLANAVLIKLNQIGTVTETLEAIQITQNAGWRPVISARSGETEDSFISHLVVASNAGQLKVGSFTRSERMVKWNEVLRIKRSLDSKARFQKWRIF